MIVIAIGTFFAAFTLPSSGVIGLLAALVGMIVVVFGLNARNLPRFGRTAVILAGVAIFVVVPGKLPQSLRIRTVGTAFFPEDDRSEFIAKLETPPGPNLEYTRLKAQEVGRIIRAQPEVLYTYTTLA